MSQYNMHQFIRHSRPRIPLARLAHPVCVWSVHNCVSREVTYRWTRFRFSWGTQQNPMSRILRVILSSCIFVEYIAETHPTGFLEIILSHLSHGDFSAHTTVACVTDFQSRIHNGIRDYVSLRSAGARHRVHDGSAKGDSPTG